MENTTGELPLRFPSWAPDWSQKDVVYPFMAFGQCNKHSAGTFRRMEIIPTSNPNILSLNGVMIDEVAEILPPHSFKDLDSSGPDLKHLVQWCCHPKFTTTPLALVKTLTGDRDARGVLITDPRQHLTDFCAFLQDLDPEWPNRTWRGEAQELSESSREANPDRAKEALWRYTCYRSVFFTKEGRLGLGPGPIREGDKVVVFWGSQVPSVVREKKGWWFLGECYVDRVMEGEVVETGLELR
ncbi:hypothetical protein K469DRAFT_709189 [Zopfia rhizophila CBS 207.26]|uniref:Uncharacterized protein n=1 Tax=Zopfia rhizophila CBS 207.26 TaxID=1314779 RepID=A0A6A6DXM3_9PEZI|nr:hypothetical protein K469DRAFT_709189 [Zopfia rhizophila CBS 207.26]